MNPKRLLLTVLAGFAFIFASDFLIHAVWLAPSYKATAELWRTDPEMQQRFLWMLFGQLLCAVAFSVIWAMGFAGRPLATGVFFGFFMGIAVQVWAIAFFVVAPLPGGIAAKWFFSGLLQATLLGVIIAAIYRPRATPG
ncbi:MAG: hypothetical protein ABI946_05350 [Chthoniobacterales bacterium]